MAAVPVTIVGTLTDSDGTKNVTLAGLASLTGLEVGGGPIMPPSGGPPSIWPSPGHPEHPIYLPPTIWPDPPNPDRPHPEHPIVIPPPAEIPNAPPLQVKVIWIPPPHPQSGWAVVLVPTGPHPAPGAQTTPAGSRR